MTSLLPYCASCTRRLFNPLPSIPCSPTKIFHRGAKKLAKKKSVKVRLLRDVARYGRQGTVLAITPMRMRNEWFPHRIAEYVALHELRALNLLKAPLERDFSFRPEPAAIQEEEAEDELAFPGEPGARMTLLDPYHATQLLSIVVPRSFTFYRVPRVTKDPPAYPTPSSFSNNSSQSVTSAAADLAAASSPDRILAPATSTVSKKIYGSVSTADVAARIRKALADDPEGVRVVVTAEDISFVPFDEAVTGTATSDGKEDDTERDQESGRVKRPRPVENGVHPESDRVNSLGQYKVAVKVKGSKETVRLQVLVLPQDEGQNI
ncbi:MAG: hypothetical protein M1817_000022 [Caeruleum heppii]|nr:MAG: hypothetical protein M1817_000022 [Caeruleum heppii]